MVHKIKQRMPAFLLVLFFLLTAVSCKSTYGKFKHFLFGENQKGKIVFHDDYYTFGKVTEGDIIRHKFAFTNKGKGFSKIVSTKTSCGCTTVETAFRKYKSGESGELEVVVNTVDKHGIVVKTITVMLENDESEKQEITVMAELQPRPHPAINKREAITVNVKCRSCHLDKGRGQTGGFLYHRICFQCHGKRGRGASATGFLDADWQNSNDDASIKKIVQEGDKARGMPPFVKGVNPPVTDEQIDSLITYIRSLKK